MGIGNSNRGDDNIIDGLKGGEKIRGENNCIHHFNIVFWVQRGGFKVFECKRSEHCKKRYHHQVFHHLWSELFRRAMFVVNAKVNALSNVNLRVLKVQKLQ